ncbi:MAG: hypothetical protein WBC40_04890 [Halobacteriota archaeon]
MEGFARDGSVYQCYAAEEPISTGDLYDKQRNKITKCLNTFKDNKDRLIKIFGPTKISRWVLVVPRWESKDLLKHAEKKAEEIRNANLPYVADSFFVHIATEEDFAVERQSLLDGGLAKIQVDPDEFETATGEDWSGENDDLVKELDRKIEILSPRLDKNAHVRLRGNFIKHYIEGQNVLEKLHSKYSDLYVAVKRLKTNRKKFLETSSQIPTGTPADTFNRALSEFKNELTDEVKSLSNNTIETLSYEAVSDWLLRCPLDFPTEEIEHA